MTGKEILQSNFLEILFENRNKEYGAYVLRKNYDVRLGTALAITLSTVLLFNFLIPLNNKHTGTFSFLPDTVKIQQINIPIPEIPSAIPPAVPKRKVMASQQFTNQIQFVKDDVVTDVPAIEDLIDLQINSITQIGVIPSIIEPLQPNIQTGNSLNEQPEKDFDAIEVQPQFPGGPEAWTSFLQRHLTSPTELEPGDRKTVLIKFIVGEDGTVTNFEIMQSGGKSFDNEVIRVLKKMPKWKPAIQNGKQIKVSFTQPVTFQGTEE